jgi:hypothetical protein
MLDKWGIEKNTGVTNQVKLFQVSGLSLMGAVFS